MKRIIAAAAAVLVVSQAALAQHPAASHKSASAHVTGPGAVTWGPPPAVLPAGTHVAVLNGNPFGTGEFTLRLHLPAGTKVMPHFHPNDENVTVLKGVFHVGIGDKFTRQGTLTFPVGGFITAQANMHHYAWAEGDVIVQINGIAPFKLTYVNPADDPSAKKGTN